MSPAERGDAKEAQSREHTLAILITLFCASGPLLTPDLR